MDARTAAAYLQMSRRSLARLLAREGVRPLALGLRLRRWRRADLDDLLRRLGPGPAPPDGLTGGDPLSALEAVARRAARQGQARPRASRRA